MSNECKTPMDLARLYGSRVYLSGAMERALDVGEGWRNRITPYLDRLGIVVLNPCKKPIDMVFKIEDREYREGLRMDGDFETLNKEVRILRAVDLRLVDISDFLIVYLDNEVSSCGTWEEIVTANRQKKPVLIHCKQGKERIPDWLWGMLPHQFIFGSWDDLFEYLRQVNIADEIDNMRRWMFFDYSSMVPKISVSQSVLESTFGGLDSIV